MNGIYENSTRKEKTGICGVIKTTEEI